MRWSAAVVAAALGCASLGLAAERWTVERLFEALAAAAPHRASFRETKHLALLDRPVQSSGELRFIPPHTLEKRTLEPKPERVVVDRERVTLERGGKTQILALEAHPQVAVLVEGIRATLAGDLGSLLRAYTATLEGSRERWRLVLRPLDPSLAELLVRVEIAGSGTQVRSVETFLAGGDRSVMSISPAAR